jgi:AraC-like DNA-binding protein
VSSEWVRYFRDGERPLEAMHAHFERHTYHRHAHDTYSFGVTESGAQAFTCRGGAHTSAVGMVMAFNPDEPHDGWSATDGGFTYRIVHIAPSLVSATLADIGAGSGALPLFAAPVVEDPVVFGRIERLHAALAGGASPLQRDELLTSALLGLTARGTAHRPRVSAPHGPAGRDLAARVRTLLQERFAEPLTAADIAGAVGASRFAVYRSFATAYGLSTSDYQRLLRLRAARDLLGAGRPAATVAAEVGFADQAHLTRWFVRSFGVTPAAYRRAVHR